MQNSKSPLASYMSSEERKHNASEFNVLKNQMGAQSALVSLLSAKQNPQSVKNHSLKMNEFKSQLLNVKGSELAPLSVPTSPNVGQQGYTGLKYGKSFSQISVKSNSSRVQRYSLGEEELNRLGLRKIVKNFQGKIIDKMSSELKLPAKDSALSSIYNSDFHKNFIKNSQIIALKNSALIESQQTPSTHRGDNSRAQSIKSVSLGRVRTHSNHLSEKINLEPIQKSERSKSINISAKLNGIAREILGQEAIEKVDEYSKLDKDNEKDLNAGEEASKSKQEENIKADNENKDEFENIINEVKTENKYSTINDEDVLSSYQASQFGSEYSVTHALSPEQEAIRQLMINQPQFFDHKAGRCLCNVCNCGTCIIQCKKYCEKLQKNQKLNWISSYRNSFRPKVEGSNNINALEQISPSKIEYKSQPQVCQEIYSTIQKTDFQPKEVDDLFKIKKKQFIDKNAPFPKLSSYSSQYVNWGAPKYDRVGGSQQRTVIENLPFNTQSTYDFSYHNLKLTPQKNLKPRDQNPLPNIGLFLGESTYGSSNQKVSNFERPPKRQPTPPEKIPGYDGQYKSEMAKAFSGQTDPCKGKEKLKEMYLQAIEQSYKVHPSKPLESH